MAANRKRRPLLFYVACPCLLLLGLLLMCLSTLSHAVRFFGTTSAAAVPATAPTEMGDKAEESSSWWDDLEFEDYTPPPLSQSTTESLNHFHAPPTPLQVPCGLMLDNKSNNDPSKVFPLHTVVVTGSPQTCLTKKSLERFGLSHLIVVQVPPAENEASAASSSRGRIDAIHGYIPPHTLWFRMGSIQATVQISFAIAVVDDDDESSPNDIELVLGLDFLRANKGIVDVREEELHILVVGEDVMVPFLRPRAPLSFDDKKDDDNDNNHQEPAVKDHCATETTNDNNP
jgi:hypothetical protein